MDDHRSGHSQTGVGYRGGGLNPQRPEETHRTRDASEVHTPATGRRRRLVARIAGQPHRAPARRHSRASRDSWGCPRTVKYAALHRAAVPRDDEHGRLEACTRRRTWYRLRLHIWLQRGML